MAQVDVLQLVVLILYLIALAGVAIVSNAQKKKQEAESSASEAHFGGSFSTLALVITTTSSVFSGVTVVGIPGEVKTNGYLALRWYLGITAITGGMCVFFPRLKRLAAIKGYTSPNDYVLDRFKSQALRVLAALACSISSVIYLMIQFNAFAIQIQAVFGPSTPLWIGTVGFGIVVLVMETLGGLTAVVYTDVVQGYIMLGCFVIAPFLLWGDFGSFFSMAETGCDNLKYFNNASNQFVSECAPAAESSCLLAGCIGNTRPDLLMYPELELSFSRIFWFIIGFSVFPLNLQFLQRCYVANNESDIKTTILSLLCFGYLAYSVSIYLGISHAAYLPTFSDRVQELPTFFAIMEFWNESGGFRRVVRTVMTCSYLAAVMSTADSVVIGVSSVVSLDIFKGVLTPDMGDEGVVKVGLAVSAVQVIAGAFGGLYVTPEIYGATLNLANGFLFQVMPVYALGLFTDISALPVICGVTSGLFVAIVAQIFFTIPYIPSPFLGLFINFGVIAGVWKYQSRQGLSMDSTVSVNFKPKYFEKLPSAAIPAAGFALSILATPWWKKAGTESAVNGVPDFALVIVIFSFIAALCNVATLLLWKADSYSESEETDDFKTSDTKTGEVELAEVEI